MKIRNDGAEIAADLIEEMRKEYLTYAMMIADDERKRMEHFHQNRGPLTEYAENTDESGVLTSTMTYESFFTEYPEKVQHIERVYREENPWLKLMLAWKSDDPLDKDVLRKYVFRIVIDQLTTISVELKEQQWLMALPREWRE